MFKPNISVRLILCATLCLGPAQAQMTLTGAGGTKKASAGGGCSQATTFLARTSGLSGTETTAYTALICGLVADGTFSSFYALYIFATNNTTTAALNLVSTSYGITPHGTLTLTADRGWAGDGSTGYLDTGFVASASGASASSMALGIYDRTSNTSANFSDAMGVKDTGATTVLELSPNVGVGPLSTEFDINDTSSNTLTSTNGQGFWIASRTTSSSVNLFMNGTAFSGSPVSSTVAGSLPNQSLPIAAFLNFNGSYGNFDSDQFAAMFVSSGLTTAQMASVSSRINAYMTAVGANVY